MRDLTCYPELTTKQNNQNMKDRNIKIIYINGEGVHFYKWEHHTKIKTKQLNNAIKQDD